LARRGDGSLVATGDWSHALLTDQFQSRDAGMTWQGMFDEPSASAEETSPNPAQLANWTAATGVPVAIRDACQIGESKLLAVGDHGVILISADGGRSWRPCRGEGRQTAVLIVAKNPTTAAWGLLGKEAMEHRNRVAMLVEQISTAPAGSVDQTAVMLGGSAADALPALTDPRRSDNLTGGAQDWIAVHRPSVLVLDHALQSDTQDVFMRAATAAGVKRVIVYRDGIGSTVIHRDALLPNSGALISDFLADAAQLVAPGRSTTGSISLTNLYDVAPLARRGDSVTGGIDLQPGQQLATPLPAASRRQLPIIQARRNQTTQVAALLDQSRTAPQFSQALRTILDLTAEEDRFRLAWMIYVATARQSRNPLATAFANVTLAEIASRFPGTSAAEWARLLRQSQQHSVEHVQLAKTIGGRFEAVLTPPDDTVSVSPFRERVHPTRNSAGFNSTGFNSPIRQVSAIDSVRVPQPETQTLNASTETSTPAVDLAWEFHPINLLAREAARQRGDSGQLQSTADGSPELRRLVASAGDPWSALLQPSGPQVRYATRTSKPPKLDGRLDDRCWNPALMTVADSRLRFAYDDEFLYVAFDCDEALWRDEATAADSDGNVRDRDLVNVDRLSLRIDTDRDLVTAYEFQLSAAGQTNEGIDGNLAWNPTWYLQTGRAAGRVVVELAILRRELAELPICAGESWFVSAQVLTAGETAGPTTIPVPADWLRLEFR
jgi:hypothetical protein